MKQILLLLSTIVLFAQVQAKMLATAQKQTIVLGSGCFWGAEKYYEQLDGVIDAKVGYADGSQIVPVYKEISSRKNRFNENNFAEVVQVTFNKDILPVATLIRGFFEHHDPTQLNRQGNDIGTQYRSIILTTNERQRKIAQKLRDEYQQKLTTAGYGKIQTVIKPLDTFHLAEAYHQDYLKKNPNGYCPDHATGVTFDAEKLNPQVFDNTALRSGKQIVVLIGKEYCPYCERFKKDVTNAYQGSIVLTYRTADQLQGLTLTTPNWATPTTFFLENGKEVLARQGYMDAGTFYEILGGFKLGKNSKSYNVAFDKGTDAPFCRRYELFKNTPDGIFVDKLSGAALFDTRNRYDSGSGWLSFTHAIAGAVIERPDNSYGMRRIQIISKSSGIHLGHVFDDGPDGNRRYCLDATVLEFRPRFVADMQVGHTPQE